MMNVMGEGGIKNGKNGLCNRFTDPNDKVARSKINRVFHFLGRLYFLGLHFGVVFSIYLMSRPNLLFTASKSEIWNLSVALLSQAKNLSVALLSQAPALLGTISWISGMSEQCLTIVLSTKPLQKLTGTDRTGRQTGAQDYVLSQADALTKKRLKGAQATALPKNSVKCFLKHGDFNNICLWNLFIT